MLLFRNNSTFKARNIYLFFMTQKQYPFYGPKYRNFSQVTLKNLTIFKSNIKSWKPENCPCHLCRLYIADIGFIEWKLKYKFILSFVVIAFVRPRNTGLMSSGIWSGEGSSLALVGNPSSGGVLMKILVWRHLIPDPQLLWVNYV